MPKVVLVQRKEMFDANRVAARARGADPLSAFSLPRKLTHTHAAFMRPSSIMSVASDTSLVVAANRLFARFEQPPHPLHSVRDDVIKQYSRSKKYDTWAVPSYQVTLTCCRVAG